jgi:polyhydroxybutyrate depolymerase
VFVFHGFQESSDIARQYTGMDAVASANGFIVAYPNGSGPGGSLSWNAGGCCGDAVANKVDETAFVRSMISDVNTLVTVDPKRIYAVGFSNGALLSYRLACEMSDTFAAVAPVAGVLLSDPCQPVEHVALMDVHGLTDPVVPLDGGGTNPVSGRPFPSVVKSVETWAKLDGCTGEPQVEQNRVATHTTYGSCADDTSVELYTIAGNGHNWPSPYAVPVSQIIWQFFTDHPKS